MTLLGAKKRAARKVVLKISEAQIEAACCELLERDGWRSLKIEQNYSERKRKVTGERGAADHLYLRYATGDILWVEFKAPKGKAMPHQEAWIALERSRGAQVWLMGRDFECSFDAFYVHYKQSGLNRKLL